MKPDETTDERGERRPRNKANMSEPQEEFITPESSHVSEDAEPRKETPPSEREDGKTN